MPDRSRSGGLALVLALAGLTACQVSPSPLGIAARPPEPLTSRQAPSQPLTLVRDADTSVVVDARDGRQVAEGVRTVIASRVKGLDVVQDSTGARLRISGLSTSAGRVPLFVIDGIPVADGFHLTIPTRAVERIDLMQDAAATAPYGPRASNGVVLIAMTRVH